MPERPTYRAFLSYSHKDKEQAIAWQQRLEAFDVHWAFDDLPAPSFKRVFRDETDLPLGAALTPEIYAALDGSDSLILIGSPNARDSGYVNAEIAYFRTHHPERPIVCILCGPPDTAFRDHLPKTLAYALDPDGNPTDTEETPISANPQEGEQVCAARVIGCSLNLPPDKLAAWVREIAARQTAAEKAQQERDAREEQRHKELLAEMAKMQALVTGSGVIGRAAVQGIPEPAVRAIVERLGGQDIGLDDLIPWLDNWIEHARVALRQHGNEGAAYEAAYREAERRFAAGRLTEAHDAFMEELHREQARDAERQAESRHRQVTLLEGSIEFAIRAVDIDAIVPKLRAIAAIEGLAAGDPLGERLVGWAAARYETGRDKGDNVSLLAAIVAYRAALLEYTRGRVPLDWARTQNNLGNALSTLGERESGTARLDEAVVAYRAALLEWTRERVPLDWAMTQNNLGIVLQTLGARESGTVRLEEAVAAYRAALLEFARERVPLNWAMTQNNLGNALSDLGERESGTARLEEAVTAYRAALLERTRERVPLNWATTQNNLGAALQTIGERESGTARLEEAVAAYRAALEERTRERVPLDWAYSQHGLGNALATLAERTGDRGRMTAAIGCMRDAADVYREGGVSYWLPIAEERVKAMEAALAKMP